MELIADIKQQLTVQDVIARSYPLVASGRKLIAQDPDAKAGDRRRSLEIDPQKQLWVWHSKQPDVGQKRCGGDVLAWIAYQRFGRCKVEREQFVEVLKEACKLAGIDYEAYASKVDPERQRRRDLEKEKRAVMAKYHELSEECWTAEARVQIKQRKAYITDQVIEDRKLGVAPTLKACLDAGITEKELRLVGLLCDPLRDGPDSSPYMHFKDCIIIPWFEAGEVVFLSSRRLRDIDSNGAALPKKRKSISMWGPGPDGRGGVVRPLAFNIDTIRSLFDAKAQKQENVRELLMVEGPLDAIACEEQGHAAIALACSAPTPELKSWLSHYPQVIKFLALDGTGDVTPLSRATAAGFLGIYTRVCVLPDGQDPDDLNGEQLASVKADARRALDEWCEVVEMTR